jgi:hypothetical protein
LLDQASYQEIRLEIQLPQGARVTSKLTAAALENADRSVLVEDSLENSTLTLKRVIDLPAGRVQVKQYPSFVKFARAADDALASSIRIQL